MHPDVQSHEAKAELRREAAARRDALPAEARKAAAEAIAARAFPLPVDAGHWSCRGSCRSSTEINPLPLMRRLAEARARGLALPVVTGRGVPLVMRAWTFGEPLSSGVWGIREPGAEAPEVEPDVLLVPLLAFDRAGHRLGYGGGYYDRTLALLRERRPVAAVGMGFAAQEVAAVPATPRDALLDLVLTERDEIDLRGG